MSKNASESQNTDLSNYASAIITDKHRYRPLSEKQIELLKRNNNHSPDWSKIHVTPSFIPDLIINCEFYGVNYIDDLSENFITYDGLNLPSGLYNSTIISSVIGKNVTLKNVSLVSNYHIGDHSLLFNVNQLSCKENAKFGNGYIAPGEDDDDRFWLEISNENGGRRILPYADILPADAFLWSRFRENKKLQKNLVKLTDNLAPETPVFGIIGQNCKIKNISEISDCRIEAHCRIDGSNKLTNLIIHSSENEPTFIGEDVDIQNAVIGYANKIFMGPKCENIVTGRNVKIELGARVLNTFIADNSTVACCEVLNNLVFPFHEQHHNNSFLIATTILGQSNIAAGATIGSNHNSRAADGEILAGRGFWPGLESNYKHNSYFSSFALIAKGSYETELNIELPFSLVSKDPDSGIVQIFPGFWFRYNMYALARNSWKFKNRDKRKIKAQNIEMDYLAPDSALEMLKGIQIIEQAVKKATGEVPDIREENFNPKNDLKEIYLENAAPKTKVLLIKPLQGIWLYKIMLTYFAARELIDFINTSGTFDKSKLDPQLHTWINLGGQLVTMDSINTLISAIEEGTMKSWTEIHDYYNKLWQDYPKQKSDCALYCWLQKENKSLDQITAQDLKNMFRMARRTSELLVQWTTQAREKDYTNPFRKITYRNQEEMDAVLGKLEDNSFIDEMAAQHKNFCDASDNALTKI